jgi:hypothetical protein
LHSIKEPDPHLNHFSIVAAWTNEKAYEDHEAAPYTKQFRAAIAQTGRGNLSIRPTDLHDYPVSRTTAHPASLRLGSPVAPWCSPDGPGGRFLGKLAAEPRQK